MHVSEDMSVVLFFFMQKTAYEMRISDWSSDVCSSDLPGFSVGVLLTTPPFPYTRKQVAEPTGLPILFEGALDEEDYRNLHFGEIGLADGAPVTSGLYGWTMVVTGCGTTIEESRHAAYARAGRIHIPNMRYRMDIGERLVDGALPGLAQLGYL